MAIKGKKADRGGRSQSPRSAEIVTAATRLFARLGYGPATMDELSELTGLNKGTIYYYFKSKADILFEIAVRTLDEALDLVKQAADESDPADAIKATVELAVDYAVRDAAQLNVLLKEQEYFESIFSPEQLSKVRLLQRRYMRELYSILNRGVDANIFRPMDVVVTARTLTSIISALGTWAEVRGGKRAISDGIKSLVLSGMLRPRQEPGTQLK